MHYKVNLSIYTKDYQFIKMRLCQNADTAFFYAQSPDFLKPGLCYYPKFHYICCNLKYLI